MPSKPLFNVPSGATATVKIIDSTLRLGKLPTHYLMTPAVEGLEHMPTMTTWSFLVESDTGKKALFDLGVPPDLETYSPLIVKKLKDSGWDVRAEKHVADILNENGVKPEEINSVIWRYEIPSPIFVFGATGARKLLTNLPVTGIGIILAIPLPSLAAQSLWLAPDSKMPSTLATQRRPMALYVRKTLGE